ncbi:uncharacterized protein LOC115047875 [Echeneis naucrates]|nr:uncharacterized protein LOC115047875 [Echeneis naucrates]
MMMQRILAVLQLLLLPSVSSQTGGEETHSYEIYHYTDSQTWWQARDFCRRKHTDLVTIRSKEEATTFFNFRGWIGLYRFMGDSSWKWSYGKEDANYTNFILDELESHTRLCAYKRTQELEWRQSRCDDSHTFLCFDDKRVLVKKKRTWESALNYCRNIEDKYNPQQSYQNHRYDLATLITEDDRNFAKAKAQEADTEEVWTALRFLAGGWIWTSGETVTYRDIKSCPKTKLCGTVARNNTMPFGRQDCQKKLNFLCYVRDEDNLK